MPHAAARIHSANEFMASQSSLEFNSCDSARKAHEHLHFMMKAESRLGRRKLEDFRGKSVLKELHRLFNNSKATMRLPTLSSVRLSSNGAYVNQLLIFLLSLPRGFKGMTI